MLIGKKQLFPVLNKLDVLEKKLVSIYSEKNYGKYINLEEE
jgi:hypothetical protein